MLLGFWDSLTPVAVVVPAVLATCGYVVKVARDVNLWRIEERIRNQAVDAVLAEWNARGLTPEGAVEEGARFRDLVDNHESALADTKRRVDLTERRLARVEKTVDRTGSILEHLNDRFDDVEGLLSEMVDDVHKRRTN